MSIGDSWWVSPAEEEINVEEVILIGDALDEPTMRSVLEWTHGGASRPRRAAFLEWPRSDWIGPSLLSPTSAVRHRPHAPHSEHRRGRAEAGRLPADQCAVHTGRGVHGAVCLPLCPSISCAVLPSRYVAEGSPRCSSPLPLSCLPAHHRHELLHCLVRPGRGASHGLRAAGGSRWTAWRACSRRHCRVATRTSLHAAWTSSK